MKEKYVTDRSNSTMKLQCNTAFGRIAELNIKGNVLVLDSEDLNTTKHLISRGIADRNIYVPNPYSYAKMRGKKKNNLFNMLLSDYINKAIRDGTRFSSVWLDYCCSFDGNDDIEPKKDIEKMLGNQHFFNDESYLAVTFSYRNIKGAKFLHEDYSRCNNFICQTGYNNFYAVIPVEHRIYKGMFFILYKVIDIHS